MLRQELESDSQEEEGKPKLGLLFSRITQEFQNYEYQFEPEDGILKLSSKSKRLNFEVHHISKRSLLARVTEGHFHFRIQNSTPGDAEIHLNHSGLWKRTGIQYKVKRGQSLAEQVAENLIADSKFHKAFLPLDSRRFHLIQDEQGWMVDTSQMGASFVGMLFPPMKRYVPMGHDQVATLGATFRRLQVLLSNMKGVSS